MKRKWKRIFAFAIAFAMVFTMMPGNNLVSRAKEGEGGTLEGSEDGGEEPTGRCYVFYDNSFDAGVSCIMEKAGTREEAVTEAEVLGNEGVSFVAGESEDSYKTIHLSLTKPGSYLQINENTTENPEVSIFVNGEDKTADYNEQSSEWTYTPDNPENLYISVFWTTEEKNFCSLDVDPEKPDYIVEFSAAEAGQVQLKTEPNPRDGNYTERNATRSVRARYPLAAEGTAGVSEVEFEVQPWNGAEFLGIQKDGSETLITKEALGEALSPNENGTYTYILDTSQCEDNSFTQLLFVFSIPEEPGNDMADYTFRVNYDPDHEADVTGALIDAQQTETALGTIKPGTEMSFGDASAIQKIRLKLKQPSDYYDTVAGKETPNLKVLVNGENKTDAYDAETATWTYTPESEKGLDISVFWTEEEYQFATVGPDGEKEDFCIEYNYLGAGEVSIDDTDCISRVDRVGCNQTKVIYPLGREKVTLHFAPKTGENIRDIRIGEQHYDVNQGGLPEGYELSKEQDDVYTLVIPSSKFADNDWLDMTFEFTDQGENPDPPQNPVYAQDKDVTLRFWRYDEESKKYVSAYDFVGYIYWNNGSGTQTDGTPKTNPFDIPGSVLMENAGVIEKGGYDASVKATNSLAFQQEIERGIAGAYLLNNAEFDSDGILKDPKLQEAQKIEMQSGTFYVPGETSQQIVTKEETNIYGVELPVSNAETESYDILLEPNYRHTIVWENHKQVNFGEDALVANGTAELLKITDAQGNDLTESGEASVEMTENGGYCMVPVGAKVTIRLIPDYGYQVKKAELNGGAKLIPNKDISSFTFEMPDTNIHFSGLMEKTEDEVAAKSSKVGAASIANGKNAAIHGGNVKLTIDDHAGYNADQLRTVADAAGQTEKVDATVVAALDMTLDNIINKAAADAYWTEEVREFDQNVQVTVALKEKITLGEGETIAVVREHNGTLEKIDAVYKEGVLTMPTNKFSTYSIVKLSPAKSTTPTTPTTPTQPDIPVVSVSYHTHIQTLGDSQGVRKNGAMAGTTGIAKRLENIWVKVEGNPNLGIQYSTHCQSYGWLPWSANGETNGTSGEAKRLEAIKIRLTGEDAANYDVYYRVHAQSYGWLAWAKNGDPAGTAGKAKRLEGIQIVVLKKGSDAPGANYGDVNASGSANKTAFITDINAAIVIPGSDTNPNISYRTHVQTFGWQEYKMNGAMAGTTGKAKRLEGINIKLSNCDYTGGIRYMTHIQTYGWSQGWKENGAMAGTSGEAKRLEAIRIELTGEMAKHYDIYYRVHAQSYGWLNWASNGAPAGTAGMAKRLEGIQIVLVKKGEAAPANNYQKIITVNKDAYIGK